MEPPAGRLCMELAGDVVDVDGLALVLGEANRAAGGQLEEGEVALAAVAIMQR